MPQGAGAALYEMPWTEPTEAERTKMVTMMWDKQDVTTHAQLVVTYRDQQIQVSISQPAIIMGRSSQCDLIVNHQSASRLHARIEYKDGNFVLVDQSGNGTFVRFSDGDKVKVHMKGVPIRGAGDIGLGDGQGRPVPRTPCGSSAWNEGDPAVYGNRLGAAIICALARMAELVDARDSKRAEFCISVHLHARRCMIPKTFMLHRDAPTCTELHRHYGVVMAWNAVENIPNGIWARPALGNHDRCQVRISWFAARPTPGGHSWPRVSKFFPN